MSPKHAATCMAWLSESEFWGRNDAKEEAEEATNAATRVLRSPKSAPRDGDRARAADEASDSPRRRREYSASLRQ